MKSPTDIMSKTIQNLVINPASRLALETSNKFVHTRAGSEMLKNDGIMIVLTASDIEMSDFNLNPFIAFSGGFPKSLVQNKLYPPLPSNLDGTAKFAPYGLRKVESLLIQEFGEENVVTVHPSNLHRFIGSKTKIVAISTMDPLGIGFVSRTYTGILGMNGKPATLVEFEKLLSNPALKRYGAKIVVGGSGAWQISTANMQEQLGIDAILIGQAEHSIIQVFRKALDGGKLEKVITMQIPKGNEVPVIKKPSIYGTVEIMRGCGRGCAFCSPTLRQRYSFPLEHILKEVELNAKSGTRAVLLQTDDVFLYNSKSNFIPNRDAIVKLIQSVNKVEDIDYIQIAHASLAPAVYDKKIVEEIAPILVEKSLWSCNGNPCVSIEVGIETGSARLMKKYMGGKMLPYKPEQWQDVVVQSLGAMNDNNVYPLATLILGLPGEQEEDILATIELLDRLRGTKIFYVPLLFTSEEESILKKQKHKDLENLDDLQWDILSGCWRHNVNTWKPEINKTIMVGSTLLYPYLRLKHGKKIFKPFMKFSGLEELILNEKVGTECQPEYCTPALDCINDGQVGK